MMKRVLSVGQCEKDHGSISRFLNSNFDVEVVPVATVADATQQMRRQAFNLVLVNRQFDLDGTEGIDFIRGLKSEQDLAAVPVMLITNFPEYAAEAVSLGAEPGFGKAELSSQDLPQRLNPYLA
jgi:DNA-binding NarL/FixJ family response regulator